MANEREAAIKLSAYAMCVALGAVLAVYDYYVFFMNRTNHTGIEVRQIAWAGLLCGVAGAAAGLLTRRREWLLATVLGVALFANVYGLERAGVMMNYDDWARSGMPERYGR